MTSYQDLPVWQQAMDLRALCHALTRPFAGGEISGLCSQILRAAALVADHIADGHGRNEPAAFVQFLRVAQGSLKETETHLTLASRVGLLEEAGFRQAMQKCSEIRTMLRSLRQAIEDKP